MKMSTQIGDLIFESGKTLFEILDSLDVPQVASQLDATNLRLDEVNDQLRQLSVIVDTNQANNNASFVSINTQLDSLRAQVTLLSEELLPIPNEIASLTTLVNSFDGRINLLEINNDILATRMNSLDNQMSTLNNQMSTLNNQMSTLTTDVAVLSVTVTSFNSRITSLEANKARQQFLFLGNEYIFCYRTGGAPGTTYYYRITYSGSVTSQVNAAIGYSANVLDSSTGTSSNRTVYLAAPFDMFSVNGRYNYPMIQGPCVLSFAVNNTSPITGYITTL